MFGVYILFFGFVRVFILLQLLGVYLRRKFFYCIEILIIVERMLEILLKLLMENKYNLILIFIGCDRFVCGRRFDEQFAKRF